MGYYYIYGMYEFETDGFRTALKIAAVVYTLQSQEEGEQGCSQRQTEVVPLIMIASVGIFSPKILTPPIGRCLVSHYSCQKLEESLGCRRAVPLFQYGNPNPPLRICNGYGQ